MSDKCQAQQFDTFALNNSALFPPSTLPALWEGPLPLSPLAFAWTMPEEPLPSPNPAAAKNVIASVTSTPSLLDRILPSKFTYATGEIGFMYGRSTGKYGGSFKQGYITGETGNDKTQIFAGASYEDSNFRVPRFGR